MSPNLQSFRSRVLRYLAPSGLRRHLHRRRLSQQHGVSLGPDFDFAIADNVTFGKDCRLGGPCYVAGSDIGAYTYIEIGSRISAATIGRFCSIAPYAIIGMAEHPTRQFVSTHPIFYRNIPRFGWDLVEEGAHEELSRTHIGSDVWIGAGASVKTGVTVGDGAVIGAGAVVVDDLPPYMIYGGVPARPVKQRFGDAEVRRLLELRWWDRDRDWIARHAGAMQDVEEFLAQTAAVPAADRHRWPEPSERITGRREAAG